MLENNGGTPLPNGVCREGEKEPSEVCDYFFSIDSGRDYEDWVGYFEEMKGGKLPRLPLRLVPIAPDPFGNLFCIAVTGADAGKVYFWHHEEEFRLHSPDSGVPDDSGVSLMADSFEDFLSQFAASSDDEPEQAPADWESLIEQGNLAGFNKWLDNGGNLSAPNAEGITPIILAVDTEQIPIVISLLDRGVTAAGLLGIAIGYQRWKLVLALLEQAKESHLQISSGMLAETLETCSEVNVIKAMLDAGAPVQDEHHGDNPLYSATLFKSNAKIVKLLLERGAKLAQSSDSRSPLANAICLGKFEAVKLLLDAGESLFADPQKKTKREIKYEALLKEAQSIGKPRRDLIEGYEMMIEHEKRVNRPKPAVWYLDHPEASRIPAKFKKDVIAYAMKLGQKPSEAQTAI